MKVITVIAAILSLSILPVSAQQPQTWEDLWEEMTGDEDDDYDEAALDDDRERLAQLAGTPIDLNRTTREELEQLPFLSELQVMDIVEYVHRYGPVRSLRELKMIRSLDYRQLQLLPFFVTITDDVAADYQLNRRDSTGRGRRSLFHPRNPKLDLTFTGRVPFYDRRGDSDGYLGYRYRHSLRAEYSDGQRLRAGVIGAQDAGEPFFANGNRWGYDHYAYYVQVGQLGILDRAIVGHYRVSAGMGLVLGGSFRLGKLASLMSLGRQSTTLRPHTSRSEADYFRGAALSLGLLRRGRGGDAPLRLTVFASYRPMDATLNADGTAATLTTAGYHRTASEMDRKDNTHLTAFGARLAYSKSGWRVGLNGVTTHLNRELRPQTTAIYRQIYPAGTDFTNASVDYGYTRPRLTIGGETAVDGDGHIATVNRLGWQASPSVSIVALWRYYGMRYSGLYGHSFGNNSSAQNEQGFFLGATWRAAAHLTLMAYADYARHPWAKYLVSQPSQAFDVLFQADWHPDRWRLLARSRLRFRERDDETKEALTHNNDYRLRLSATRDMGNGLTLRTQADAVRAFYLRASLGFMVSEQLTWQHRQWQLNAIAAYFNTDDFASRLYLYERQMAHEYYMPSYFGRGLHLAALATWQPLSRLSLSARLAYTNYSDRDIIGTGLQQINGSYVTDLDLQLRWRLFRR